MLIQIKAKPDEAHHKNQLAVRLASCAAQIRRNVVSTGVLGSCALIAACSQITACDAFSSDSRSEAEIVVKPQVIRGKNTDSLPISGGGATAAFKTNVVLSDGQEGRIAVSGSDAIPYPIYPEAKQYRVGGENGLHVVIFETNDSFEEVDSFYQNYIGSQGYARLVGMADYVRYDTSREAAAGNTSDAWRNDRPGIVIHGFTNRDEAINSGADAASKTNIIVSY